jgi:tetratricopeptide (TPR) repeat protein
MDSEELDLDVLVEPISQVRTDIVTAPDVRSTPRPGRMPVGSIPPPVRHGDELDELRSRASLHRSTQQWADLAQTIRRILDVGDLQGTLDEQETIELHAELGEIEGEKLGRVDAAVRAWREVVALDASDLRALTALEKLYVRDARWPEAMDVLERRVLMIDNERARIETWLQAAAIAEDRLQDLTRAAQIYERVRGHAPSNGVALGQLQAIYRQQRRWAELVEILLERSEAIAEAEPQIELLHEIAEIYERELDDHESAFYVIQAAFNRDHSHERSARELERLAAATGRWQELLDEYTRRVDELERDDRGAAAELRVQIARWHSRHHSGPHARTENVTDAIATYERLLELEPRNLVALRALEGLYEKSDQHDNYLAMLEAQLELASSATERVSLYERIAAVWEERFDNLENAAAAYEKVVQIDARNHAAYHLLARLYQRTRNHEALVETYRRHIASRPDDATRIGLYVAIGQIYDSHLQDVCAAADAYCAVLSFDANHAEALEALARLYEKTGSWKQALDVLARLAQVCDEKHEQDLYWRMGKIQYAQLGDRDGAEANLQRSLALDPGHLPTMKLLTEHYADRGDWLKATQMMLSAKTHSPLAVDKVRLLCEAANVFLYELGQEDQARKQYAAAIALDPEHVGAGRPLADLLFKAEQWAELSPVLDMLCRKLGRQEGSEELFYRAARCADELGNLEKALGYYATASDLDPSHALARMGHAEVLFKLQRWDGARSAYQTVLAHGSQGDDDARIYARLGKIHLALGDRAKALAMFEQGLAIDPHHADALHAVIELHAQQRDWRAVVRGMRALIETASGDDKVALLGEIGTIHRDHLHDVQQAAAAYFEALDIAPDDHQLLQKVLDLCTETKQWKRAVETIERFVALETDSFRRGLYFHAAGTLCRDELKALDQAIDHYECALDSFFSQPEQLDEARIARALRSFEAIDKVLTTKRDWNAQERAYREMIKRLPQGTHPLFHKLQVSLLDGLAEIYRSRLKQYQQATDVFEIAQQMDPNSELRRDGADRGEILAELYLVAGPDRADKAIEQHTRMLRREPFKYDSYKELARIYSDTHQYDKRWCVSSTLAFLKKADAEDQQFYERYRPRGLVKARHGLNTQSWAKLAHSDENRMISAIFGACWQGVAAMKAFPHRDFGVKREDRRQLHGDQLMFSKLFVYAAKTLNVPLPDVYLNDDATKADMQLANAMDKNELCPSFVVRPHLLQGKTEREVAFLSARRLAFMRPEYYLRMLLPTNTELKVVVLSAIAMFQPRYPVASNMVATVQQYLPQMKKRMAPHALEQLGMLVQRFVQSVPEVDLAKWGHAVDATAHRAGLVVCGDLETSARAIAAEPMTVGAPAVKDKLKELVLFSASEEYFAIRAQTGTALNS